MEIATQHIAATVVNLYTGGEFMHPKPYRLVALVISLLLTLVTLVPVNTFGAAGSADVVVVEGVTKTFQVRDWDGQVVEVALPSRSHQDIQTNAGAPRSMGHTTAPADRTVRATVMSVDAQKRMVKVQTQYGQTIVLTMHTEDVQPGEEITLVVPW
jgi:hypothetical protein